MGKRSEGFERRPRGFYPTPWEAFTPLIPHLPDGRFGEPCAGDGALCAHLAEAGFNVVWASDIAPQHPNVRALDACSIQMNDLHGQGTNFMFVTNPPWPEPRRNGEPTLSIAKHLSALVPTWLLLPSDFMHNVYAAPAMRFCHKVISVGRVRWIPGSVNDGKDNAAWYLFDQSREARTIEFAPRIPKGRAA